MNKELINKIGKFKIYLVDGDYVKLEHSADFTNFGQHYRFSFIPKNEFWIDQTVKEEEIPFFIDHILVEHKLMKNGLDYDKALKYADKVEKKERKKSEIYISAQEKNVSDSDKKVNAHLWKEWADTGVSVYLVDAELVRDFFDVDFVEGGHDKVYNYIPENQIWIDIQLPRKDRVFVLVHESFERNLMSKGMEYNKAHIKANREEYKFRHEDAL